jgi:nucleotide-binding universal stress UspA family protein
MALGATVAVVTSMEKGTEGQREEITEIEKGLEWAKSLFDENEIACDTHLLIRGLSPGEDIVEFAKENEVDEIIVGVKRRSKVGKLLMGSTAQYIILKAPCPVVSVK